MQMDSETSTVKSLASNALEQLNKLFSLLGVAGLAQTNNNISV
jgi:hypothetical protein